VQSAGAGLVLPRLAGKAGVAGSEVAAVVLRRVDTAAAKEAAARAMAAAWARDRAARAGLRVGVGMTATVVETGAGEAAEAARLAGVGMEQQTPPFEHFSRPPKGHSETMPKTKCRRQGLSW